MVACLFCYMLDVSLLIQYLGGNYTGAHYDVHKTTTILLMHGVNKTLVLFQHYKQVVTVGYLTITNTNTSRNNALQYWQAGNNPLIKNNLSDVMKATNKED